MTPFSVESVGTHTAEGMNQKVVIKLDSLVNHSFNCEHIDHTHPSHSHSLYMYDIYLLCMYDTYDTQYVHCCATGHPPANGNGDHGGEAAQFRAYEPSVVPSGCPKEGPVGSELGRGSECTAYVLPGPAGALGDASGSQCSVSFLPLEGDVRAPACVSDGCGGCVGQPLRADADSRGLPDGPDVLEVGVSLASPAVGSEQCTEYVLPCPA